jgi:hypothetical protein
MLVETSITIVIAALTVIMNLELIRRAQYEWVFHHTAFLDVRLKRLKSSNPPPLATIHRFLANSFGDEKGKFLSSHLKRELVLKGAGLESQVFYRFPSFQEVRLGKKPKHHFQMSRRCYFP